MSTEENKALSTGVRKQLAQETSTPSKRSTPQQVQEFKQALAEIRQAFPDNHGTNETQTAEGDMVAARFVFHGTHRGEFMGIAPTGREVTFEGLSIDKVVDDKIVESWVEWDLENIVRQIGAVVRAEELSEQPEEASPT